MRILNSFIIAALIATITLYPDPSHADDGLGKVTSPKTFYGKQKEGWFFYNEKYDKKKKKHEEKKKPSTVVKAQPKQQEKPIPKTKPVYTGPPPLSAAWMKVNLPKYMNRALDDPSPQNVRAYLILQKVSIDKTQRFTNMASRVTVTDPVLDELTRRPFATSGVNVAASIADDKGNKIMKNMGKFMGLWVFYRDPAHCQYCNLVGQLTTAFQRIYGFKVLPVSLDGTLPPAGFPVKYGYRFDNGQSKEMNVVATPAIFLVNTAQKDFISVGQGSSMSIPELKQRVFLAALQKHWISNEQYAQAMPNNDIKLLSDSDKMLTVTDKTGFVDPEQIVNYIEKSFGKRRN